ncbi:MAG: phage tail length tape measure family protein [Pelagimonas sp.]|uniref:phage tail length tape measure family protein n=1 Tax=Pelagimonas sp. TaxID=2073170 RepID=UPI003D6BB619
MTLRFHSRLTADGKQAKVEIKGTAAEVDKLSNELKGVTRDGSTAAQSLDKIENEARQAAAALQGASVEAGKVKNTHNAAAGSVGNLTAQLNDTFVTAAAGQAPMQIAIQQGTQIGQVFQQTGVKGKDAFKLLLSGATAMVSPINLITIGSIAAGAAMLQWLNSSSRKAKPLAEQIDDLGSKLDDYRKAADLASESTEALEDRFGQVTPRIRAYLQKAAASEMRALKLAQREIAQTMVKDSGLALPNDGLGDLAQVGEMMGYSGLFSTNGLMGEGRDERRAIFSEIIGGFRDIKDAADKSTDAQIAAAERLRDGLEVGSRLVGGITSEELTRLRSVEDYLMRLYEIRAREPDEGRLAGQAESAWTQYYQSRVLGERALQAEQQRTIQQKTYDPYQTSRVASEQSLALGQDLLATMQHQNELTRIAVVHGADSVEMTEARAAAERRAFEELLASQDVSEALKEELRGALEESQAIGGTDVGAGIRGAVTEAGALVKNLGISLKLAQRIASFGPQGMTGANTRDPLTGKQYGGRGGDPRSMGGTAYDWQNRDAEEFLRNWKPPSAAKAGRGRGGSLNSQVKELKKQQEAVEQLTRRYDDQLAILRESDPVQKEMLRNRETLAHATDAERKAIEAKITTLESEKTAQDQASAASDYLKSTSSDLIPALVRGGEDAASAWDRLTQSLEAAAWQALLLGEGPLMKLLSGAGLGGGGGGLVGGFLKLLGFADGGMNYGKGGGRDDANLALISSGEFTVNAQATARHRALLEAINSGAPIPGFANGGGHGAALMAPAGGFKIQFIDQSRGVDVQAKEITDEGGGRRLQVIIDERMAAVVGKNGSATQRAMRNGFNLSPARARR